MKTYITGMLTVFFMAGCSSDEPSATRTGFLLTLSDGVACEVGRTVPADLEKPAVSQFQVRIVNQATQSTAYEGAFKAEVPVASGTYTLTASAGENPVLDWDQPYYWGTADATVDNSLTPVTISCKVANALLTVTYANSEEFQTHYTDYKLRVSVATRSLDIADGETRSAYFQANSEVKLTFVGTLKETGTEVSRELQWPEGVTLAAGTHTQLSLTASVPASGAVVSISKATVTDVTISQTLPNEWLPKPKVGNFNGGDSRSIDYVETADAVPAQIPLTAASPIQDIQFSVAFNDENLRSLNGEYRLSTMTDEQKQAFATAGVTLPELGGTATAFDFTHLTASLWSNAGATVTNTIKVKLSANDRESDEQTFTIHTQGPQFSVSVYPGNIWTKEFTAEECIVTAGSLTNMKKKGLVYQYRELPNGEWNVFSDNVNHKHQFINPPIALSYEVRALYRDVISTNIVPFEMEEQTSLPNGNMDAWNSSTYTTKYGLTKYNQPFFEPWDTSIDHWWDTNNYESMHRGLYTIGEVNYKCFPTSTYSEPGLGGIGKAAMIRSVNSYTGTGKIIGDKIRGILYIGETSTDGVLNEGRHWKDRPTAFSFYYKYHSYDNERFGVYLELYSNDTQIAYGQYLSERTSVDNYTYSQPILLNYTDISLKPTMIKMRFCSVAEDESPALQKKVTVYVPDGSSNSYKIHAGSALTIDEIALIYDK